MFNIAEIEPGVSSDRLENSSHTAGELDLPASVAKSGDLRNYSTLAGLFLLVLVWAYKLYTTWGAWGNVTIDSGHEMYVPWMLAEGKQLYRDTFYSFGPAAPYFTSYLYRLFGARLEVLYWAGSLSALGSAVFLYFTGIRLSSHLLGWTAGAVILTEAFQPSLFSFPLPYSSAAVYGCLIGCLFLWLTVNAALSRSRNWLYSAGAAGALALLLKPEFGVACYGALLLLVLSRSCVQKSWSEFFKDILAILPGIVICTIVLRWMISIAGVSFLTQENILSWPSSYFMRTYGKAWLERSGFTVSASAFAGAVRSTVPVSAVLLVACIFLRWRRFDVRSILVRIMILLGLALYLIKTNYFLLGIKQDVILLLTAVFFPQDMVLYVLIASVVAWCHYLWRRRTVEGSAATPLVMTFASLLAFRILMKMDSLGYSIFYNGPVVLAFLLVICKIVPRIGRTRAFVLLSEGALCIACLTPVTYHSLQREREARDFVPWTTTRGSVRLSKHMAESYTAAIEFMKDKAALGQSVLSVPEDTSLYFFAETECPTRLYAFVPGVLAPGKMTSDTIRQIEEKPVRYLLWSNRSFSEYGAKTFGVDFDRTLGDYLKSHYRRVRPLISQGDADGKWAADVWERIPDAR